MTTTKTAILAACFLLVAGVAGAAPFNFGISPTSVDQGDVEPGSNFYVSFDAISRSDADISFDIRTSPGDINRFEGIKEDMVDRFSAQGCPDCIRFLPGKGGGELQDIDQSGGIQKWKAVEFLVSVPDDIEPGYHLLEITPEPQLSSSGGGGGVDVVSATTLPVMFNVPGEVERSGKIIGLRAGTNLNGRQEIEATYYNTGTVTTETSLQFRVETSNGETETLRASSQKVQPGETTRFSSSIDADELNATFQTAAIADYHTGEAADQAEMEKKEVTTGTTGRVTERTPKTPYTMYLLVIAFLALSATVTWLVVRHLQ